jgi:hypothetical protein
MAINKIALLRLADKLEGKGPYMKDGPIKKNRFNMGIWVNSEETIKMEYNKKLNRDVVLPNLTCGTAACACGWAGSDPWFRKRGFYTTPYNNVIYEGLSDFSAVEFFFKINRFDSKILFSGRSGDSPKSVAQKIRKFVEDYEREREMEGKL